MERKVSFHGLDAIMAQDINLILDRGCITVDDWMSLTTQQWGRLCIHSYIYNGQNTNYINIIIIIIVIINIYIAPILFNAKR